MSTRMRTHARALPAARVSESGRSRRRARLTALGGMIVRTPVIERKIPFVELDIVPAARLLRQLGEPAVGALLAQLLNDLAARRRERHHPGGRAADHLEDEEAVIGRHQAADLAGLARETGGGEGGG